MGEAPGAGAWFCCPTGTALAEGQLGGTLPAAMSLVPTAVLSRQPCLYTAEIPSLQKSVDPRGCGSPADIVPTGSSESCRDEARGKEVVRDDTLIESPSLACRC